MKPTLVINLFALILMLSGCATTPPTVTLDEYNRIQNGMTYGEANGIVGEKGKEMSRTEIPGAPLTVMYGWQNSDGSNMNAMFQNDKLVTKAQFGLK